MQADRITSANHSNTAELFTIPQDQMSHVQVLTVEPTTLTADLAADWLRCLQQLSYDPGDYAGQRAGQPDRCRSRAESDAG